MKKLFVFAAVAACTLAVSACKKSSDCQETAPKDTACFQIYDPVCGCNNKTYGNACEAEARGITDHTPGECK